MWFLRNTCDCLVALTYTVLEFHDGQSPGTVVWTSSTEASGPLEYTSSDNSGLTVKELNALVRNQLASWEPWKIVIKTDWLPATKAIVPETEAHQRLRVCANNLMSVDFHSGGWKTDERVVDWRFPEAYSTKPYFFFLRNYLLLAVEYTTHSYHNKLVIFLRILCLSLRFN